MRPLLLALLVATVALTPVFKQALYVFWTTAAYRGLVSALELATVLVIVRSTRIPMSIPVDTGRWTSRLFLAWAGWSLVTVVLSEHRLPAVIRQAEWFAHIAFAVALWHHLRERPSDRRLLLALLPAGMLLVTAALVLFWRALADPFMHPWSSDLPFFNHVRHYGYLGLGAVMACLYPLLARQSWTRQVIAGVAFVVCLAALMWAGGRGSLLGLALGLLLALKLAAPTPRLKIAMLLVVALPVGVALNQPFKVNDHLLGIGKLAGHQATLTSKELNLDTMSTGRVTLWRKTLVPVLDNPVTGLGPDGFAYLAPPVYDNITQPHSMPLQFFADWGIPGTLAISAWLLLLGARALTLLRTDAELDRRGARITAGSMIVAYVVHGLTDGTFYHSVPMMAVALCFAIVLQPNELRPDRTWPGILDRRLATAVPAVLLAIMLAHVASATLARSDGIPAPDSLRASLVRAFPSHVTAGDVGLWVTAWRDSDPVDALDWTRWAQTVSRDPWYFYREEAALHRAAGNLDRARTTLEHGIPRSPVRKRPLLAADLNALSVD